MQSVPEESRVKYSESEFAPGNLQDVPIIAIVFGGIGSCNIQGVIIGQVRFISGSLTFVEGEVTSWWSPSQVVSRA
jgi:hypothetical protein